MKTPTRALSFVVFLAALATVAACGPKKDVIPKGNQPDKFLFDRGNENIEKKRWLVAREYYRQLVQLKTS